MIAQKYRFRGHGSLGYVYKHGQIVRARGIMLRCIENRRRKDSRCSVSVSKKVAKSAVIRNRIRRRLYENIRREWPTILPGHDLVFVVVSSEVAVIAHDELTEQIRRLLTEARLYRDAPTSVIVE